MSTPQSFSRNKVPGVKGCITCNSHPCERLRFGRVYPGKFLFVHKRLLGYCGDDCPFFVRSFEEVQTLLGDLSLMDIIPHVDDILSDLSLEERFRFSPEAYISGYDDLSGRINLCQALWDDDVLAVIAVPFSLAGKGVLNKWLRAYETLSSSLEKKIVHKNDGAAVTDELAGQGPFSLVNPRWEHTSDARKNESPAEAVHSDTILMMVDAQGMSDGAKVTFDIFDASSDSPKKIHSVIGSVTSGVATAKWSVGTVTSVSASAGTLTIKFDSDVDASLLGEDVLVITGSGKYKREIKLAQVGDGVDINDAPDNFSLSASVVEKGSDPVKIVLPASAPGEEDTDASSKKPAYSFEAKAGGKTSGTARIAVGSKTSKTVSIRIQSTEDSSGLNDTFTLKSKDGAYSTTISLQDASEFSEIPADGEFTLSVLLDGEDTEYSLFENETLFGKDNA